MRSRSRSLAHLPASDPAKARPRWARSVGPLCLLLLCGATPLAAAERQFGPVERKAPGLSPIEFRASQPGRAGVAEGSFDPAAGKLEYDARTATRFQITSPTAPGLLARYRQALERETRRHRDRDPTQGWLTELDEEEAPADGVRREARRLFKGASNRILSQALERVLEASPALRQAREYAEGVRLDVRRGGGVSMGAGKSNDPTPETVAARFHFVIGTNPRVEMRTTLPGGIRTRVEVAITNPGVRASFSKRIGAHLNGTLAGGYEESGDDRWVSAGLGVSF